METLYRIDSEVEVANFVIDEEAREAAGVARSPREQLLLQEDADGLAIGLYLDAAVMESMQGRGAAQLAEGRLFGDFMMMLEGVSHFVYVAFRAGRNQQVSALELELQAEVDKYVTCLLSHEGNRGHSEQLRERLFKHVEYDLDLCPEEQERYRVANNNALRYTESLERRYVARNRLGDMLVELRKFYRLGLRGKMHHIRQAA
ncbi:MAG: hypothetical protein GY811_30160 [Myxococcales bacterium]|nr:hypothetical protein [Myxococcales bacterium]